MLCWLYTLCSVNTETHAGVPSHPTSNACDGSRFYTSLALASRCWAWKRTTSGASPISRIAHSTAQGYTTHEKKNVGFPVITHATHTSMTQMASRRSALRLKDLRTSWCNKFITEGAHLHDLCLLRMIRRPWSHYCFVLQRPMLILQPCIIISGTHKMDALPFGLLLSHKQKRSLNKERHHMLQCVQLWSRPDPKRLRSSAKKGAWLPLSWMRPWQRWRVQSRRRHVVWF